MRTMIFGRSGLHCLGKAVAMLLVLIPAGCPTTFGHPASVGPPPMPPQISLRHDLAAGHHGPEGDRKKFEAILKTLRESSRSILSRWEFPSAAG
jgi:hypothetical protein